MTTVAIIARREYAERIKQRGWIIGTVIGVVVIIALSFLPVILIGLSGIFGGPTKLAVVTPDAKAELAIKDALVAKNGDYDVHFASGTSSGPSLPPRVASRLKAGTFDAALVAYREPSGDLAFRYYPRKSSALDDTSSLRQHLLRAVLEADSNAASAAQIEHRMNFHFSVQSLNARYRNAMEEGISQALSVFLLVVMYMAVILYGVTVAQGVIEEKSNRVMELMIAALRPAQLLAGKIIGIGLLALTQFALFGIVGLVMLVVSGIITAHAAGIGAAALTSHAPGAGANPFTSGAGIATVPWTTWVYLVLFFLLGFFTYSTLSAGIGALASKAEDVQGASMLYTMPLVAAYLISFLAINDPEKPFVLWTSMVPLLSPMVMFTRISAGTAPGWQIVTSIALSLIAIWLLTLFAGKLYRVGVLMYGKPPRPADIWRALRSPV